MKKIVLCGNYGINNLGDEAICRGMIKLLDGKEVVVMSSNPKLSRKLHQVEAVPLFAAGWRSGLKRLVDFGWWKSVRAVRSADLMVLGGGGLFTDKESVRACWIWFVQAMMARILGCRYCCLAQSVGPVETKMGKWLTKWVFERADLITVRDEESAGVLRDLGIDEARSGMKIEVAADAAFAIGYDGASFQRSDDYAVLSLRPWKNLRQQQLLEIAEVIDWLYEQKGLRTCFIAFQNKVDEDQQMYEQLREMVIKRESIFLKEVGGFEEAVEAIARARLLLGMRLHSLIFGVIAKTPLVGISYSDKVENQLKKLGLLRFQKVEDLEARGLMVMLEELLESYHEREVELEKIKMAQVYDFFRHEGLLEELLK